MASIKIKTRTGSHVNLDALLEFNKKLIQFKKALYEYSSEINQALNRLERDGWKDEKFSEYKIAFDKYIKLLEPLGQELEQMEKTMQIKWVPFIRKHLENKNLPK
ncbi:MULTISPECIES: hypothetical protein [Capnocytophaga]|uniref:hypothetical protein n=1 Tax=Capnocytophaga TaxID=1016 RepID=UPI000589773C|nr:MULTISPECIES: hypothetical protein [Capnocytophaga]CEN44307.1 conserved hypothetical protein [Capnocytophaga canimorsus]VEJ18458.1 Uncharacterised protein [Capnocytophaga canimorsus]